MQGLEEYEKSMQDLNRKFCQLADTIKKFKSLQLEIGELQAKSDIDPMAKKKLAKVSEVLRGRYSQKHDSLINKLDRLKRNIDQLEEQCKKTSEKERSLRSKSLSSGAERMLKRHHRTFA